MMRMALPLAAALALTACNDGAERGGTASSRASASPVALLPAPARTVLDFLENPAALEESWARCRNDPGGIGQTPECQNAGHAKERVMMLGRERGIDSLKR